MVFQNCRYTYIWYTHCINVNIHVYTNIYTVIYSCIINTVLRSTSKELPSTLRHLSQVGMLSVLNQSPFFARWPGKMFQPLKIQESYISTYMIYIYIYIHMETCISGCGAFSAPNSHPWTHPLKDCLSPPWTWQISKIGERFMNNGVDRHGWFRLGGLLMGMDIVEVRHVFFCGWFHSN